MTQWRGEAIETHVYETPGDTDMLIPQEYPQLLRDTIQGDRNAADQLFSLIQKQLYPTAYKISGNIDDAIEVVQDSIVAMLPRLGYIKGAQSAEAIAFYALSICRSKAMRQLMEKKKLTSIDLHADDLCDSIPNPESQYMKKQMGLLESEFLAKAMGGLTDVRRRLLFNHKPKTLLAEMEPGFIRNGKHRAKQYVVRTAKKLLKNERYRPLKSLVVN